MIDPTLDPDDNITVESNIPPEFRHDLIWRDLRYIFQLLGQYFAVDPKIGISLAAVRILTAIGGMAMGVQLQVELATITDALVGRNASVASTALTLTFAVVLALWAINVVEKLVEYILRIRWRHVFTDRLLDRWYANGTFHRLESERRIEYPEQRIQEDLYIFAEQAVSLVPSLAGLVTGLTLFSGKLWGVSPSLSLSGVGIPIVIPSYLFFLTVIFALLMTVVTHKIGNYVTKAEIIRQRLEAGFRHDMAMTREYSEAIAMGSGGPFERNRAGVAFALIRRNWRSYTIAQSTLSGTASLVGLLTIVLPFAFAIPMVLAGKMTVGGMQLTAAAFAGVYASLTILVGSYHLFALLRASAARIHRFDEMLGASFVSGITVGIGSEQAIQTHELILHRPDGNVLVEVGNLSLRKGERVIVRGRSGAGKSTLLRAIAGIWPYGSGRIDRPSLTDAMILPQRAYMPDATLAALLSYPRSPDMHDRGEYSEILHALSLDRFIDKLDQFAPWSKLLSPGEQQRIAIARVLLARPAMVLLDEATSALDPELEGDAYSALIERLPDSAILSVAHRHSLGRFHQTVFTIADRQLVVSSLKPSSIG